MQHSAKSKFVIIHGNMLGCINPADPLSAQILASRVGAAGHWLNGSYPLPLDPAWVGSSDCPKPLDLVAVRAGTQEVKLDSAILRPATRADIGGFRLCTVGYEKDTDNYDFPAN
jgi:hypothetical protein